MATVKLTEADSHRQVAVSPGDKAEVRLPENPTTGFRWHAVSEPPGALVLESDGMETAGGAPGAGGVRVLSFRTTSPGLVALRLKLWRDWEGESSVQARHDFVLEVKAP